jgi:hypothetical protein
MIKLGQYAGHIGYLVSRQKNAHIAARTTADTGRLIPGTAAFNAALM